MTRGTIFGHFLACAFAAALVGWGSFVEGASRDDHLAILGVTVAGLLFVTILATKGTPDSPASASVVAAAGLVLLSYGLLASLSPSTDESRRAVVVYATSVASFLLAFLLASGGRAGERGRLFLDALAACAVGVGMLSVLRGTSSELQGGGLAWPFGNHALLGCLLAAGAMSALAGFRFDGDGTALQQFLRGPMLLRLATCALLCMLVVATGSRSAMIALGVGLSASPWALSSRPTTTSRAVWLGGSLGVTLLLLGAAAIYLGTHRRFDEAHIRHGSVGERLAVWGATLRLIETSPWLGAGVGAYPAAIWRHTPARVGGSIEHAHSQPLEALAERGILGCTPVLLAGWVVLRILFGTTLPVRAKAGLLPLGVVILQSAIDLPLAVPALSALAASLLGTAAGLALITTGRPSAFPPHPDTFRVWRTRGLLFTAASCAAVSVGWGLRTIDRARSEAAFARGDSRAGLVRARRAVARNPRDRDSLRRLAEAGDRRGALSLAALDPTDPYAALGAADVLESEGRLAAAEAEIRRAIVDFPAGFDPKRALLEFLVRQNRLSEAIPAARAIVAADPARAAEIVGWLATTLENPLLAEELAPPDPLARRSIAVRMLASGYSHSAVRLLRPLCPDDPSDLGRPPPGTSPDPCQDPEHPLLLASAYGSSGQTESAREILRRLLDRDPSHTSAAMTLAQFAASPAEQREAEEALRRCLENALSTGSAVDGTAERRMLALMVASGRREDADGWIAARLRVQPDLAELVALRMGMRQSSGDFAGAMSDARRLIDLAPHDPRGRLALAHLYERNSMVEGARDLYRQVLEMEPANSEAADALARLSAAQEP